MGCGGGGDVAAGEDLVVGWCGGGGLGEGCDKRCN